MANIIANPTRIGARIRPPVSPFTTLMRRHDTRVGLTTIEFVGRCPARLKGLALPCLTTRNPDECPAFAELRAAQIEIDQWYIEYSDDVQDSRCGEVVNFSFIGGGSGSMSRGDILLHVINHTTYHRGHIGCMIYQVPAEPPTTDLPVFLREHAKE